MVDVLIIGAGPAGLSAAIYVQRSGKKAVCLEALVVGGQIVNTPDIANYPGIKKTSGFEFSMGLYEQATELGAEVEYEKAVSIKKEEDDFHVLTESGKEFTSKAVIIATGAKNRHLGIDKEEALTGHGISYCATCDGAFYKKKDVAVNGGGNTALEDALFLSNYCNKVYIIHRRDEFRGEPDSLEAVKSKENVELVLNSTIDEIKGDTALEAVVVKNKETGELREIPVAGLFIAIGQEPDNKDFEDVALLDKAGYIDAGEDCKTKTPGVFVAGDCRTKSVRQLTTAASDGAVAALAACAYISSKK
ncbi:MAG: thioredoxin-disulfide reductase [Eubacterium sp.]|jgi:thioredoxin reductase (NADPH)|nr:thioredoxin-disulfide reductase [Eubacterium sp.]MEE3398378.1 thioredoxin-disulfide reductase [Eubacterium sp.]